MSLIATFLLALGACKFPRDPEGTTNKVMERGIRVGVSQDSIWTQVERELIQRFAAELGVRVHWVASDETELFEALKDFQIDIVIGGLTMASPYKKTLAFTKPYHESKILVGGSSALRAPGSLKNLKAALAEFAPYRREAERKGADTIPMPDPFSYPGFIIAPEHEFWARKLPVSALEIKKEKHVLAVPPGENRWLVKLEEFLKKQKGEIIRQLLVDRTKSS